MFKTNNSDTRTTPMALLLTLNIFRKFVLVFLLLTLNMQLPAGYLADISNSVSIF